MSDSKGISDDDLLARLSALKGPSGQADKNAEEASSSKSGAERSLESRFRVLSGPRAGGFQSTASSNDDLVQLEVPCDELEEDKTLDELLKELAGDEVWVAPEKDEIEKALKEARTVLPERHPDVEGTTLHDEEGKDAPIEAEDGRRNGRSSDANDEAEADEYVQKVLAEVDAEDRLGLDIENDENSNHSEEKQAGESKLELPSAPSVDPARKSDEHLGNNDNGDDNDDDDDDDDGFAARLSALSLPGAPTKALATKSTSQTKQKGIPKFTDDEIESWCIICCEDAMVRCLGCDGDLYCNACWTEGHVGKDVGLEERKHKAVTFEKPGRKNRKQQLAPG